MARQIKREKEEKKIRSYTSEIGPLRKESEYTGE